MPVSWRRARQPRQNRGNYGEAFENAGDTDEKLALEMLAAIFEVAVG
jgi:hypothetical protein